MSDKEKGDYIIGKSMGISGKLTNYEEFYLLDDNKIIYKIILAQKESGIIIKSNKYYISFNLTDILSTIPINFNTIFDLYNFFLDLFKQSKVSIKNILIEKEMELEANIKLKEENKNIFILLKYNKENPDFNYMELYNNNLTLNLEIEKLKKELNQMKQIYQENKGPQNLTELSQITKDSYSDDVSDNTFTVFKSIQDYIFLIYSTKNKSIICYDLIEQKKLIEIKNSHQDFITNFRHFLDKKNKRDILMTISCADRNIKLWDASNWECILDLKGI